MTQDAAHIEEDNKQNTYFFEPHNSETNSCINMQNYDVNRELTMHNNTNSTNYSELQNIPNCVLEFPVHIKKEETTKDSTEDANQSPNFNTTNSSLLNLNNSNFIINSSMEDTLKNLKMSIRRKRLCSSSSALSNNDTNTEQPKTSRKKKKRKNSIKDDKILTFDEQYVTQTGEMAFALPIEPDTSVIPSATSLEVPRWRVKVYTSCYSMESTENLDDEVYNKRHMRLEIDERRRKRWDVQRIREQRIIEKLKQRQERIGSGSRTDDQSEPILSLWPTVDDIKYLEVCDQLPVSAFGAPIPRFTPSEFSLPWLNNTNEILKKPSSRKSTIKRKATKR